MTDPQTDQTVPKNVGFRPTVEDEARLIALRSHLGGRANLTDAIRKSLEIACEFYNLSIEVTEQS